MAGHVLPRGDGSRVRRAPSEQKTDQVVGHMKAMRIIRAAGTGLLLVAATGASAEGDGVAMKSLLGAMGIIPRERPPIEYRERPPLVVPPKAELRAPIEPGSVESRAANWPKDPDVAARRRAATEARMPVNDNTKLSPEEIQAGRRAAGPVSGAPVNQTTEKTILTPDELRAADPRNARRPVLAGAEPERQSLTEPPTGYRKPAANAPMRATEDEAPGEPENPYTFQREQAKRR